MTKQDIAITVDSVTGLRDIAIGPDGDFLSSSGFDTSIDMSVMTNRRASSSEVPEATNRRGWIGDLYQRTDGFKAGSTFWIYEQKRLTTDVIANVRNSIYISLLWMIERGGAQRITVTAAQAGPSSMTFTARIFIGQNVITRYFNLWNNTQERTT